MTEKFQKLVDANIELLPIPEITTHFVFHREGFAALVVRAQDSFGTVGAAGLVTERGIAPLQWRDNQPFFVLKDFSQPATSEQVEELRSFQQDLQAALA